MEQPIDPNDDQQSRQQLQGLSKFRRQQPEESQSCSNPPHQSSLFESQEMQDGEHRWRLLFDAMQEGFGLAEIITDESGKPYDYRVLELNRAAGRLTGFTPETVVGKTARELAPTYDPIAIDVFGRVALSGDAEHFDVESRILGKWFDVYVFSPVRGQFACTFFDITDRKRTEAALRDSEERFRLFMDNSPTIAWMKDEKGRYVYVCNAALNRYGKKVDDIIGKTDADLFDPEIAEKFYENDQEALSAGHAIYYRETFTNPDGKSSFWLNSKFPFQDSAGNRCVAGIGIDITEQKRMEEALQDSEQKFRALYEHSQVAVLLTIPDGTIEAANPAACAMFGYTELEFRAVGRSGILDASDPRLAFSLEERRRTGRAKAVELTAIRKGGERFPVEVDSVILPVEPVRSFVSLRDITERKRAEQALRESESLFRAIAANFPDGAIYVFDHDLRFRVADGQAMGRLGFTREGLEGKTIWEATGPEICRILEKRYPRVLAGESLHFETAVKRRIFATSYVPIWNEQGEVIAGMVVSRDITERKRSEEKLKESEERFRTMADGLPLIVWVHDAEGNLQFVNQTFLDFFGVTHDEMKGGRWRMLAHPDDAQGYSDEFMACVREQRFFHREVRVQHADGNWRWFESWGRPRFTASGKYLGHVGTSADITDRKNAEAALAEKSELLEGIYRHIPVLLVLWDPHLNRFTLNRHAEEVLGYSTAEANEGDFTRRVYPDDAYREKVSAFMQSLEPGWREWIGRTKDGKEVPIEWANVKLSDDTMIGFGVDLRERKKAETALRESHQELNEYTYALTHNIKAPFRAVQNYASFLLEDLAATLEGEPRKFLNGIKKAIGQANQQFEDLEALYKVKDHPLEFESLDMRQLLREIADLHDDIPDHDLVVEPQWPILRGERYLLRQILMALVSNGFKYNRSDIKRVEVTWLRPTHNRFEIVVRDNGIGIDPQYYEHIFQIFKRLHTEEEYEGTGIGLAIVRRAAQRIGAELRIESAVGQGSTFLISLPAAMVDG